MKKFPSLLIISLLIFSAMQSVTFAAEPDLIGNIQLTPSPVAAPSRVTLSFDLLETIDLSQENTNIIIEYLGENLETTNYIKNKYWSGYLNSYDNYPSGEHKYSSGYLNEDYPDIVPAARIYTVTKTGANIDVSLLRGVKITVLRADGSGEQITVGIDGSILNLEEIELTNNNEVAPPATEQDLGIRIDSETAILPPNTILVAEELSSGSVYNVISSLLADAINFIAIDIKLESSGQTVQPDGKVKISIPIPEDFNISNLAVYRIADDGEKIPYAVTITTSEETEYATFLTDHFSTYVLVEERMPQTQNDNNQNQSTQLRSERRTARENETEENKPFEMTEIEENKTPLAGEMTEIDENKIPITGRTQTQNYMAAIIFIIGLLVFINIKKITPANQKKL